MQPARGGHCGVSKFCVVLTLEGIPGLRSNRRIEAGSSYLSSQQLGSWGKGPNIGFRLRYLLVASVFP